MRNVLHRTVAALLATATLLLAPPVEPAVVIGSTEVPLDARVTTIRYLEGNVGNLVADAFRWQALQSGLNPTIGFQNSGGIRSNAIQFPGAVPAAPANVTDEDVFALLPFGNHVVVINSVSVSDLLLALENAVSASAPGDVTGFAGRFLQVSGFRFSWNPSAPVGSRIIDAILDDATPLINDGVVVSSMFLNIATNNFLAQGGDFYSMLFPYLPYSDTGAVDHDVLTAYIQNSLGGLITAADYPGGGEGRIQQGAQLIPEPAMLAILGLGLAGLAATRRRRQ